MSTLRFATWNLMEFGRNHRGRADSSDYRLELAAQTLKAVRVDAVAVQEFCGRDRLLARLARVADMSAYTQEPWRDEDDMSDGALALENGAHGYGVGLMWRPPAVRLVGGTDRRYSAGEFWHGLIHGRFRLTDPDATDDDVSTNDADLDVFFGSYHAPPAELGRRSDEAERILARMRNPHPRPQPPVPAERPPLVLLGGDFNCIGESTTLDPDPYADQPWTPKNVHRCQFETDETGNPVTWRADRRPAQILHAGGLIDAARAVHTGQTKPTVGHHPDDPGPLRRLDTIRVSERVLTAVTHHEVVDSTTPGVPDDFEEHFDHKLALFEVDLDLLRHA